jgi:hypothetical protein
LKPPANGVFRPPMGERVGERSALARARLTFRRQQLGVVEFALVAEDGVPVGGDRQVALPLTNSPDPCPGCAAQSCDDRPAGLRHLRDVVNDLEEPRILRKVEGAYEAVLVEIDIDARGEGVCRVELKGIFPAFRRAGTDRGLRRCAPARGERKKKNPGDCAS